jgi:DNA-binding transcriptional LysR family regulator
MPIAPSDILGHEGICMSNVAGSDRVVLRGPAGVEHTIFLEGRLRVDLALGLRKALVAGRGIGHAHHWLVHDLLAENRLVPLLPEYELPTVPLSMLILPERAGIARVRAFIDFFAEHVSGIPGIER